MWIQGGLAMQDFEKLGVFYLGKEYDLKSGKVLDDLTLYKSKDLTTHAVIIGMTGSGKTGLGIDIIEEAAIDNIPVLAIDPKGDLGNLALTFPKLTGEAFKPWINLQEAQNKGLSADDYAAAQAELWSKGLAEWGEDGDRISRFKNAASVTVFTPGGSAGPGVSLLKAFNAPGPEVKIDAELYRDRISVTTDGLLSLVGLEGDPFNSREHILISNIIEHAWNQGQDVTLEGLIQSIQTPPIDKVGVMDIESFFPSKERFSLALMLNNLLASPSFKDWLEGAPLDINRFCYDENGKPRISVFSIAHLEDRERMFFVTLFLNEVISWMRSQPGTGSLRALLYMDELYGYLPPVANPPSKSPLLTLLKQARAYGLGLVLSTQNPVDLDYKALSNAGSWFIGRLQTERDKERVLAGLEGAAVSNAFDRGKTEKILAGLGQRIFYLHNVHDDAPEVFSTRWTLSYLAGPLTREQISSLPGNKTSVEPDDRGDSTNSKIEASTPATPATETRATTTPAPKPQPASIKPGQAPLLNPAVKQVFIPTSNAPPSYSPYVMGAAEVNYNSDKYGVSESVELVYLAPLHEGLVPLDWNEAVKENYSLKDLSMTPVNGANYLPHPSAAADAASYDEWKKMFVQHIRNKSGLSLFYSSKLKTISQAGEDERDFRIRLQHKAHEMRDDAIEKLKDKYQSKFTTLAERQRRAEQAVERENTQASQRKMEAAVSAGSAILGALFGKKALTATSISKVGTAVSRTSRAMKSGQEINQAQDTLESVKVLINDLELELKEQTDRISRDYELSNEPLETVAINPSTGEIAVRFVGLAWKDTN
jgi:hypothetical protein